MNWEPAEGGSGLLHSLTQTSEQKPNLTTGANCEKAQRHEAARYLKNDSY